jgi:hypothetical protein
MEQQRCSPGNRSVPYPCWSHSSSRTLLSNGTASIEQRLARWLLMAQDRLDGNEVPLTHEFLSLMLGVRRAGVTGALNQLDRKGVIRLSRGRIEIVDREGLIGSANGTYGIPEAMARRHGLVFNR